jgi:hypothetical protein
MVVVVVVIVAESLARSTLLWIRGEDIFVIFSHTVKYVTANFLLFKKIIIIIIIIIL